MRRACEQIMYTVKEVYIMRLSKSQLAVITILNVIIAALVTFIFVMPLFAPDSPRGDEPNGPDDADPPPSEVVHNKFRDGVAGKAEGILLETQLMGSGDEEILGVYRSGEMLYMFGNTTVGDYDFDGYGGFLCRVDGKGKIAAYDYFAGRITAVNIVEGGFAAAVVSDAGTDAERSAVYFVDYDGKSVECCVPGGTVCDIMPAENGTVAVVTQRGSTTIELAEYIPQSDGWKKARSTAIANGFALEYFDCYMLGEEYTVAARASSLPRYDAIAFFTFRVGGDPQEHIYGGNDDNLLEPYAVLPYPRGYAVLAKRGGSAIVAGVDYSFTHYRRDNLQVAATGGGLIGDGETYYATLYGETPITYTFGAELDDIKREDRLNEKNPLYYSAGRLFVSTGSMLEIYGGSSLLNKFDITDAAIYCCMKNSDGTYTVVLSATGGSALSAPKGGREAYVLKLEL